MLRNAYLVATASRACRTLGLPFTSRAYATSRRSIVPSGSTRTMKDSAVVAIGVVGGGVDRDNSR
jgi:hypothetical protein